MEKLNESDKDKFAVYGYLKQMHRFLKADLETFQRVIGIYEKGDTTWLNWLRPTPKEDCSKQKEAITITNPKNILLPQPMPPPETTGFGADVLRQKEREKNQRSGNLSIPIGLMLLIVADCIGSLLRENNDTDQTLANFHRFFEKSKEVIGDKPVGDNSLRQLSRHFRHGMAHLYFPKKELRIYYDSTHGDKELIVPLDGVDCLNVRKLEVIVMDTFQNIMGNEDKALFNRMECNYLESIGKPNTNKCGETKL